MLIVLALTRVRTGSRKSVVSIATDISEGADFPMRVALTGWILSRRRVLPFRVVLVSVHCGSRQGSTWLNLSVLQS